jgi:hypothetical protein
VAWSAYRAAFAGAIDRAAAAVADDLIAFPIAEPAAGFRSAFFLLPPPVMIAILTPPPPAPGATADDGPITAAAGAQRMRWVGDRGDEFE